MEQKKAEPTPTDDRHEVDGVEPTPTDDQQKVDGAAPGGENGSSEERKRPKVVDRRRVHVDEDGEAAAGEPEAPRKPTYVEVLENKVTAAEAKLREHIERLENESAKFRARQERELERRTQEARKSAVTGFLAIADNMARGSAAAIVSMKVASRGQETLESLVQGVQMIQGRFFQELASLGVQPFASIGEKFDPERHEAVRMEDVTDPAQDGMIIEELCQGYELGGEVLRPSQVAVGKLKSG